MPTSWTPPEIARDLRISREKVLNWIRNGLLRGVNVGEATQPRYRVFDADYDKFKIARTAVKPPPTRRRRKLPQVEDFFPNSHSRT